MKTEETVNWDDLRIALDVARTGSLSRSADRLGMNHSTVLRRINRLEKALGTRLFIRHQRGYQRTEAGDMMLGTMTPLAGEVQRLLSGLSAMETSPSGTLKISTVSDFSGYFAPLMSRFRESYPQIRLQVVATDDVLSLSRGDVHVSIRMGEEPQEPDLIARFLMSFHQRLYASKEYVERYGLPHTMEEANRHLWVLPTGRKRLISGIKPIVDCVNPSRIVFQSNSFPDIYAAVVEGMGIGPIGLGGLSWKDASTTSVDHLVPVDVGIRAEPSNMWFVYHKDMRGSSRIRALLDFILNQMPEVLNP